jgi:hypothetical protein
MAAVKKTAKAPGGLEEARIAALDILEETVRKISEANGATSGLFFPNGVHMMQIQVETEDARIDLSIGGPEVGPIQAGE